MAYVFNAAGNGSAPLVVPVGGPPGQRGAQGADSTVPGPVGPTGGAGRDGAQGPAGAGAVSSRRADASVPLWSAVVASDTNRCIPANPSNSAHRGRVIGVTAYGGMPGAQVEIQSVGDLLGPVASFTAGMPLFVGEGGALTSTRPTSGWRQIVATAVSSNQIVVALGEAAAVENAADALIAEGGFAAPCALDGAAEPNAANQYVTPAANARALASKASLNYTPVDDKDYHCVETDVQVGMVSLTAPRTIYLPDVDTFPFQELVIADESGNCSPERPIIILPSPETSDILDGSPIILESTRIGLRFRRGATNLWIRL